MSTHHGFIKEFPWIRVDAFDGDPAKVNPFTGQAPFVYLLTHAHTDHITGLDSPNFQGAIYATAVTKHLLENTVETGERVRYEELPHARKKRKFANLRSRCAKGKGRSAMDQVREIQLDVPKLVEGPNNCSVLVTALDANHCPGACMFLIEGMVEGRYRAVIVTGDIRAEDWWLESLKRHPMLARYLAWNGAPVASTSKEVKGKGRATGPAEVDFRLDNIYLDTSCMLVDEELVPKEEAIHSLVQHIAEYPPQTRFFLNSWTWGYEEMLKGIHRAFGEQIHLDWYKHNIYSAKVFQHSPFDTHLASLGTRCTAKPLRFHACERRWKCDQVWGDGVGCYEWAEEHLPHLEGPKKLKQPGKRSSEGIVEGAAAEEDIVYVNPAEMPRWKWDQYKARLEETLELAKARDQRVESAGSVDEASKRPNFIIVPLARHSSLPELQRFVALFEPRTLYPLTILEDTRHPCRDYLAMPDLFAHCLERGGAEQLRQEAQDYARRLVTSRAFKRTSTAPDFSATEVPDHLASFVNPRIDTAVLNVEGGETIAELVEVWSRLRKDQELPPLSPKKVVCSPSTTVEPWKQQEQENDTIEVVEERLKARRPLQRPDQAQSSPFLPLTVKASKRLLSYGDGSQDPTPQSTGQMIQPASLAPSSTPLLPSPAIQTRTITTSTEPDRKRLKVISNTIEGSSSVEPDPSPLDPPPTKATTHISLTPPSPPSVAISAFTSAVKFLAPDQAARGVIRPSRETRAARQRVLQVLYRKLGGLQGPDGAIVPFEADDPRLLGRSPKKRRTTPEHESFKTVSASVTASGGSREGTTGAVTRKEISEGA